jgi:hypothetical protein
MRKTRLIFYLAILALLMFLYCVIIEALYLVSTNDINEKKMIAQLIAVYYVPVILVLGFIRLWLLKPVNQQRSHLLDIPYFVIPVLMITACFTAWIWVGIIFSVLAGVLILYEFIWSVTKMDSLLFGKR